MKRTADILTWPEYFFLHNSHLGSDVGEDRGLDEETLGAYSLTALDQFSPLFLARLDVRHHTLTKQGQSTT